MPYPLVTLVRLFRHGEWAKQLTMNCESRDAQDRLLDPDKLGLEVAVLIREYDSAGQR